jgi:hypothetical protein
MHSELLSFALSWTSSLPENFLFGLQLFFAQSQSVNECMNVYSKPCSSLELIRISRARCRIASIRYCFHFSCLTCTIYSLQIWNALLGINLRNDCKHPSTRIKRLYFAANASATWLSRSSRWIRCVFVVFARCLHQFHTRLSCTFLAMKSRWHCRSIW